jgi:hypothetical protein
VAAYRHVLTLMGFVFGFGLAQLLTRLGALTIARRRVRFSGLSCASVAAAAMLVYFEWLALWDLRDQTDWNVALIGVSFVFALSITFVSTIAAPLRRNAAERTPL